MLCEVKIVNNEYVNKSGVKCVYPKIVLVIGDKEYPVDVVRYGPVDYSVPYRRKELIDAIINNN